MFSNIYPEFHQLYPQVHIDPIELSVHDQNPLLLSGQLDIGFMTLFESQEKKGLEYLRIAKESLVLAVPSDLAKQMALHGSFSASDSAFDNDKVLFPECNLTLFKDYPFILTHTQPFVNLSITYSPMPDLNRMYFSKHPTIMPLYLLFIPASAAVLSLCIMFAHRIPISAILLCRSILNGIYVQPTEKIIT